MAFTHNRVKLTGGPLSFYEEYTTTTLYVERTFGGNVNSITISNDSTTDDVQVSYDGSTLEGAIKSEETMTFNVSTKSSVYIKATTGSENVRIWGW